MRNPKRTEFYDYRFRSFLFIIVMVVSILPEKHLTKVAILHEYDVGMVLQT